MFKVNIHITQGGRGGEAESLIFTEDSFPHYVLHNKRFKDVSLFANLLTDVVLLNRKASLFCRIVFFFGGGGNRKVDLKEKTAVFPSITDD